VLSGASLHFFVVEIIWIASLAIIVITFPIKIIIVSYYYSTYTFTPSYFNQLFKSTFCLHALPKIKNQKQVKKEISELKKKFGKFLANLFG
jgi:hypothetical protein